jgi:hypothetical protein
MTTDEFYAATLLALGPPPTLRYVNHYNDAEREYREEFLRMVRLSGVCMYQESAEYLYRDWQWVYHNGSFCERNRP